MRKEVTATGIDVNEAIDSGALMLGCLRENVEFEIVDLPRKGGFLGLKKMPAKVKVWVEVPDEPKPAEKPMRRKEPKPAEKIAEEQKKNTPKKSEKKNQPKPQKAAEQTAEEAPAEPKPAPVEVEPSDEVREKVEKAAAYVCEILSAMGLEEFQLTPRYYEENIRLQLSGTGIGNVIGRRGETLDAIQYLASLVANRGEGGYIRLSIDSGNYREKRARTLEALARKLANQAVRTGKSITLEPMNPYERRIIHGAVSAVKGATSASTGTEPNRRVVISPEEGARSGGGARRSHSSRSGRGGSRENREPRENRSRNSRGGSRHGRMEDPPAIGGPVRREQPAAPKAEKNEAEQKLLTSTTKRYGKIDL